MDIIEMRGLASKIKKENADCNVSCFEENGEFKIFTDKPLDELVFPDELSYENGKVLMEGADGNHVEVAVVGLDKDVFLEKAANDSILQEIKNLNKGVEIKLQYDGNNVKFVSSVPFADLNLPDNFKYDSSSGLVNADVNGNNLSFATELGKKSSYDELKDKIDSLQAGKEKQGLQRVQFNYDTLFKSLNQAVKNDNVTPESRDEYFKNYLDLDIPKKIVTSLNGYDTNLVIDLLNSVIKQNSLGSPIVVNSNQNSNENSNTVSSATNSSDDVKEIMKINSKTKELDYIIKKETAKLSMKKQELENLKNNEDISDEVKNLENELKNIDKQIELNDLNAELKLFDNKSANHYIAQAKAYGYDKEYRNVDEVYADVEQRIASLKSELRSVPGHENDMLSYDSNLIDSLLSEYRNKIDKLSNKKVEGIPLTNESKDIYENAEKFLNIYKDKSIKEYQDKIVFFNKYKELRNLELNLNDIKIAKNKREDILQKIQAINPNNDIKVSMSSSDLQSYRNELESKLKQALASNHEIANLETEINNIEKKINDSGFELGMLEEIKNAYNIIRDDVSNALVNNNNIDDAVIKNAIDNHNKKGFLDNYSGDKEKLKNELLNDIKEKLNIRENVENNNRSVSGNESPVNENDSTRKNTKKWLKAVAAVAGFAIGAEFGFMAAPGTTVGMVITGARALHAVSSKIYKVAYNKNPNNIIVRGIKTVDDKFKNKFPNIHKKVTKIRNFMNNDYTKWFLNGFSMGYVTLKASRLAYNAFSGLNDVPTGSKVIDDGDSLRDVGDGYNDQTPVVDPDVPSTNLPEDVPDDVESYTDSKVDWKNVDKIADNKYSAQSDDYLRVSDKYKSYYKGATIGEQMDNGAYPVIAKNGDFALTSDGKIKAGSDVLGFIGEDDVQDIVKSSGRGR